MVEALLTAAAVFGVIKISFLFFDWVLSDDGDIFVRKQLDVLWEKLDKYSLKEILHLSLTRLVLRVREAYRKTKHPVIKLFVITFTINFLSVLLAMFLESVYLEGNSYFEGYESVILKFGDDRYFIYACIVLPLLGMILDCVSLFITWVLLRNAAAASSLIVAINHLIIDVTLALVAVCWMAFCLFLVSEISVFINVPAVPPEVGLRGIQEVLVSSWDSVISEFVPFFFSADAWSFTVTILVVSISAAFPTFAYSVLLAVCILVHVTPRWLHRFITRCIYLITTEDTPVLKRLGTAFGGAAALAVAITKL